MLNRKLLRDFRINKIQFLAILFVSFLGVYIFSGINAEWMGMEKNLNDYVKQSNFADMWVIGSGFSQKDIQNIQSIDGVRMAERAMVIDAEADMKGNPTVRLNFAEEDNISKCHTIAGEDFSPDKSGVWINDQFAKARGLSVGDTIAFSYSGITLKEKIKGIVINPEYIYTIKDETQLLPDHKSFGVAFLSNREFPIPDKVVYNQISVTIRENADTRAVENKILGSIKGKSAVLLNREAQTSYNTFHTEIVSHHNLGNVFPTVFLLISLLAIITTMTRMTARQRTQIGTLKALGFSNRKIAFHYISYAAWISLAGGILGVILGPMTVPPVLYSTMKDYYSMPTWQANVSPLAVGIMAVFVVMAAAADYFACRKELGDPPAETLKPSAPKVKKLTRLEKSRIWHKAGFSVQWNFRDVMRNKARTLMGVVSVAGCTLLLICSFVCNDTMTDVSKWSFNELMHYKNKILLAETASNEQIQTIKTQFDGQLVEEQQIEILANSKKKSGALTVLNGGDFIRFQDDKSNEIQLKSSEIAMTYKMAQVLGVNVGDEIRWHIYGSDKWNTAKVEQLYKSPTNQGISMTKEAFEKTGCVFRATSVLTQQHVDAGLKADGIAAVKGLADMERSLNEQLQFLYLVIAVFVAGAVVLGVVMIYNLGVISFSEKLREIAVLRVLGFKTGKIRRMMQLQNVWITILGIILGIPLGFALVIYMVQSGMSDAMDLRVMISPLSCAACVCGVFVLSVLVNFFLSRKVKSVNMVESLKCPE